MNFGAVILEENMPQPRRHLIGSIETRISCYHPKRRIVFPSDFRMATRYSKRNGHGYDECAGYRLGELPKHGQILVAG